MFVVGQFLNMKNLKNAEDDSFFMIVDKNSLEKIDDMTGPCLKIRQNILKLKTHIHHLAHFIISSTVFDGISLFVIVCNSMQLAIEDPTAS